MSENIFKLLFGKTKEKSSQNSLGFKSIYDNGVTRIDRKTYSKTIEFFDINYRLNSEDEKDRILNSYLAFVNTFEEGVNYQLTFLNQTKKEDVFLVNALIAYKADAYNPIREDFNDMIRKKLDSSNSSTLKRKFLSFSVEDENREIALKRLDTVETTIINYFVKEGIKAYTLNLNDKLNLLYEIINSENLKQFSLEDIKNSGLNLVDVIAPQRILYHSSKEFAINEKLHQSLVLRFNASEISDEMLADIIDIDDDINLNLHFEKMELQKAIRQTKKIFSDISSVIVGEQIKASNKGYSIDLLPPDLELYQKEAKTLLSDLQSSNENYFLCTVLITIKGNEQKDLRLIAKKLESVLGKYICKFNILYNLQEQGFLSCLPNGKNYIDQKRGMISSNVATLIPYTTQELFDREGEPFYYGVNRLSKNLIFKDRKDLDNPAGLILGTPGAGKSILAKLEIAFTYLITDDEIITIDPEAEYSGLCRQFKGQTIKISPDSANFINPFEIDLSLKDDSPVREKANFILTLLEILLGGTQGLSGSQKSIIDRCINILYHNFEEDPRPENMPTFVDFYELVKKQSQQVGDTAYLLCEDLEIYVKGSMNLFSHKTNVDLNNRFTNFDIKDLKGVLQEVGIFILQDFIWRKVQKNKKRNIWTRIYIDEFHTILRQESGAIYTLEMWKRFRKYGGILTGITQNVSDFLISYTAEGILKNSQFIIMLNQQKNDADYLAKILDLTDSQVSYLLNQDVAKGLIRSKELVIPFENKIPTDMLLYSIISTKFAESYE